MSEKPSFKTFLTELKVQSIINEDIELSDMIRNMKVYIARKGAGINDNEFQEISDHIDMLKGQESNPVALEEQIATAENILSECLPFILEREKEEDGFSKEQLENFRNYQANN